MASQVAEDTMDANGPVVHKVDMAVYGVGMLAQAFDPHSVERSESLCRSLQALWSPSLESSARNSS